MNEQDKIVIERLLEIVHLECVDLKELFERCGLQYCDPAMLEVSRQGKAEIEDMFRRMRKRLLGE